MPLSLPKLAIDRIFAVASEQADYFLGLYRAVYGEETWRRIDHLEGWPKVSKATNEYITRKAIDFDRLYHPGVIPGGLWLNQGFSTDDTLPDWVCQPAGFVLSSRRSQNEHR